jgi:hypothetical protein
MIGTEETLVQFINSEKYKNLEKNITGKNNFFSYSFRRAFDESRKPTTILNRMAMVQQHINALLFEGFNVWVDKNERLLLHFDKLNNPTLKANNWECVIELNSGIPSMEKFEFEEELGEVG